MFKQLMTGVILFITGLCVNAQDYLYDDFNGSSLNSSIWTILSGNSCVSVGGSNLTFSGYPCFPNDSSFEHKYIQSLKTFTPGNSGVQASAKVYLSGDYQGFGFFTFTNPTPEINIYFDTYDHALVNNNNQVRAIVYSYLTNSEIFNQSLPATWGSYHELSINWSQSDIKFIVDGSASTSFQYSSTNLSPISIYNMRYPRMQVDWVKVSGCGTSPNILYALNVTPVVNGTITSNPSGINCGNLCSASFSCGTSVILTVSSAAGYAFSGWSGACSGTASSTCFVAMNQVQNVNANFVRLKRSSWKVILPALTRPVLDVVGMTQAAAGTALTGANLTVGTVTQQCSNTVANGLVISQNPAAGTSAPYGSAVALVVSSGKCPVTVPNAVGLTQAAAGAALTGANLTVGTVTQQCSNTVANGLVISQNPAAGASAPFGSAVALVVSSGNCPTLSGQWTGVTSQKMNFNFIVDTLGQNITKIDTGWTGCGTGTTTITGAIPISQTTGNFSSSGGFCPSYSINGHFDTTSTASGTMTITWTYIPYACSCSGSLTPTWTASHP